MSKNDDMVYDEDDDDGGIGPPYCPGRGQPVRSLHLDVEEKEVIDRAVPLDELGAVNEGGDAQLDGALLGVPFQVACNGADMAGVILDDADANHG